MHFYLPASTKASDAYSLCMIVFSACLSVMEKLITRNYSRFCEETLRICWTLSIFCLISFSKTLDNLEGVSPFSPLTYIVNTIVYIIYKFSVAEFENSFTGSKRMFFLILGIHSSLQLSSLFLWLNIIIFIPSVKYINMNEVLNLMHDLLIELISRAWVVNCFVCFMNVLECSAYKCNDKCCGMCEAYVMN